MSMITQFIVKDCIETILSLEKYLVSFVKNL